MAAFVDFHRDAEPSGNQVGGVFTKSNFGSRTRLREQRTNPMHREVPLPGPQLPKVPREDTNSLIHHIYLERDLPYKESTHLRERPLVERERVSEVTRERSTLRRGVTFDDTLESESIHMPTAPTISGTDIQTVFNASHPRDVTVHLELPISDDFGDELEEFSRLKRLGNFRVAISYFEENLTDYQAHPYIFVQYAEMLLEMGDYKSFDLLKPGLVFRGSSSQDGQGIRGQQGAANSKELNLLHLNWDLLEATSTIHRQGTIHQAIGLANEALHTLNLKPEVGSTEVRDFKFGIGHILGYNS
jgi:hypothetical protein